MQKQKIIAIVGPIASGKGTAANFFVKRFKFKKITLSNFLRREAIKRKIPVTRNNLRKIQKELRKNKGPNILVEMAKEKIKKEPQKNFVIDGLRDYREAKYAKRKLKLKIILIDADPYIRFLRQKKRARKGFSKTFHEFLHEDSIENAIFDFYKTKKLADFRIYSNLGKEDLYKKLEKIATKLKL